MSRNRKNIKTKHSDIAKYWAGKCITSNGEVMDLTKLHDNIPGPYIIPILDTISNPNCFICGKEAYMSENDEIKNIDFKFYDSQRVKHTLQRAHIIPDACGGEDEPDNYVFLCPRCHADAPNTTDYTAFMKYIYSEHTSGKWTRGIQTSTLNDLSEYAASLKLTVDDLYELNVIQNDTQSTFHYARGINESTLAILMKEKMDKLAALKSKKTINNNLTNKGKQS